MWLTLQGCGCFAWVLFKDLTLCAIDLSFTVQTTCLVWDRPGIIICEVSTLVLLLMLCGARGGNYRLGGYPTRRRNLSEWDRVEMDHCKSLVVIIFNVRIITSCGYSCATSAECKTIRIAASSVMDNAR